MWLDLVRHTPVDHPLHGGHRAACAYFFAYELPLVQAWLAPVLAGQALLATLDPEVL
jgi:butyryl-CoA dehydrogenase